MCVLWLSKWEFWQKPSCGWPFWSRRQPSRKNLLFLSPAYLSRVRLGQSLLACCLCYWHLALLSLLLRRQPDYSASVLYQVCWSSAFKILKLTFFHEAPFSSNPGIQDFSLQLWDRAVLIYKSHLTAVKDFVSLNKEVVITRSQHGFTQNQVGYLVN